MPEPIDMDGKININMSINHKACETWGNVVYAKVYAMYVFEGKSMKTASEEVGVPFDTVRAWGKRDKWTMKRKEIEAEIMESMHSQALVLISQNHAGVIKRHLDLGERLDKSMDDCLRESTGHDGTIRLEPESINFLAKAYKNSADVTHRIVKINDRSTGEQTAGTIINGPVQLNVTPSKSGRVIDI